VADTGDPLEASPAEFAMVVPCAAGSAGGGCVGVPSQQ
jgi:hypothetical protein